MVLQQLSVHLGKIKLDPSLIPYIRIFQVGQMCNDRKWKDKIIRRKAEQSYSSRQSEDLSDVTQNPEATNERIDKSNLRKMLRLQTKR